MSEEASKKSGPKAESSTMEKCHTDRGRVSCLHLSPAVIAVRRPTPLKPKYPQYDTKRRYFRKSAEYLIPGRTLKIKSSFSAALRF